MSDMFADTETRDADATAEPGLVEDLQDRIEGLEADLDAAVSVAISRGATEWARLNYPSHPDLAETGPALSRAAAAGLSALTRVRDEHRAVAGAARRHLSGGERVAGFDGLSDSEISDLATFHDRAARHMASVIADFEPGTVDSLNTLLAGTARTVALAERKACEFAVGCASAPITGTPYICGPRKFCDAIRAMKPVEETSLHLVPGVVS